MVQVWNHTPNERIAWPYISLQTGEIHESEVDISLEVQQGLCNTVDKLLMIIHEFCSIYMECKHIPEPHGCTVSSAAQLLHGLHQVMQRREREEVAESVLQHSAILTVLGSVISKHRSLSCCRAKITCGSPNSIMQASVVFMPKLHSRTCIPMSDGIMHLSLYCIHSQICTM